MMKKPHTIEADGRSLLELLRDLLRPNPTPEKIELYWSETRQGEAPDMELAIVIKAAAQDGVAGDASNMTDFSLEGGDGEADALSDMVFLILGGLGLIVDTRRAEMAEDDIAKWLEDELDLEEDTVECHKSKRRFRPTSRKAIMPDLAN